MTSFSSVEVFFDKIQELSTDVRCKIVVGWWVESYDILFSVSSLVVVLLWCGGCILVVSEHHHNTERD